MTYYVSFYWNNKQDNRIVVMGVYKKAFTKNGAIRAVKRDNNNKYEYTMYKAYRVHRIGE